MLFVAASLRPPGKTHQRCSSTYAHIPFLPLVLLLALLLLCTISLASARKAPVPVIASPPPTVLTHVTFASCNRQHNDQGFWQSVIASAIAAERGSTDADRGTDLLLWLGNAVYTDVDEFGIALRTAQAPAKIEEEFRVLAEDPHYTQFVSDTVTRHGGKVVGIWDDRDLGLRFADASYSNAEAVRRLYLTHVWKGTSEEAKDHAGDGVSGALYAFTTVPAPAGSNLAQYFVNSVCVISLDVRTQRTPPPDLVETLLRGTAADSTRLYGGNQKNAEEHLVQVRAARAKVMEADLLGPAQWAWLARILAAYVSPQAEKDPAAFDGRDGRTHCAVTVIASPLQVLLNDNKPFEGWDLYPASRSRLLLLLKKYAVPRLLFLSGHAELGELGVVRRAPYEERYPKRRGTFVYDNFPIIAQTKAAALMVPPLPSSLVEMTTGGLTHTVADAPFVGRFASRFVVPSSSRWENSPEVGGPMSRHVYLARTTTLERNFGTLQLLDVSKTRDASASRTRDQVLRDSRVRLTLHAMTPGGAPLLVHEQALDALPSFALESLPTEVDATEEEQLEAAMAALDRHEFADLPIFTIHNAPGDVPWLKGRLAESQCAEVPCMHGQSYTILKVFASMLFTAVIMGVFLLGVCLLYRYFPELFKDEEEQELRIKVKLD